MTTPDLFLKAAFAIAHEAGDVTTGPGLMTAYRTEVRLRREAALSLYNSLGEFLGHEPRTDEALERAQIDCAERYKAARKLLL